MNKSPRNFHNRSYFDMIVPDDTVSYHRVMDDDADSVLKSCSRHTYHDHANEIPNSSSSESLTRLTPEEEEEARRRRGPRGGVAVPFPEKLHMMLSCVERGGSSDVVSWLPHGRCFQVHKPKEFVKDVMPTYFRQTKLTSFQRQLNLYGFCRLTSGTDRGAYYHELFLRGRPFLCKRMIRTRIKGTGSKSPSSPNTEPDFYAMPPVQDYSASSSSLEELSEVNITPNTPKPTIFPPKSLPALVTPPAMVTPIHMPNDTPPYLPFEIDLVDPQPDSLVDFEGRQFHYLDPAALADFEHPFSKALAPTEDWAPADEFPYNDIVMV